MKEEERDGVKYLSDETSGTLNAPLSKHDRMSLGKMCWHLFSTCTCDSYELLIHTNKHTVRFPKQTYTQRWNLIHLDMTVCNHFPVHGEMLLIISSELLLTWPGRCKGFWIKSYRELIISFFFSLSHHMLFLSCCQGMVSLKKTECVINVISIYQERQWSYSSNMATGCRR